MEKHEERLELDYLDLTLTKLRDRILGLEKELEKSGKETIEMKERVWEAIPRVVRSLDDAVELLMHNRMLNDQERSHAIVSLELADHVSMLSSPYFGRIDFEDEKAGERFPVYIGKRAFLDMEELEFYVYDWRAPIASMFYDYDRGPAQYETPEGVRHGNIPLKRQFRIVDGDMVAMFDADALVHDDILGMILSEKSERKLKVIASSIQREQNAAIRCLERRDMLVLGPAGSGKTSVGLHRMAYLLYHNRKRLSSSDIMVVSANQAFNAYIANIMPDLYEQDVRRSVFHDLIRRYIPQDITCEGYYAQFDALLNLSPRSDRVRWIETLYSTKFLKALQQYLDTRPFSAIDVEYEGETIIARVDFANYLATERESIGCAAIWQRVKHHIRSEVEGWFIRNNEQVLGGILQSIADGALDLDPNDENELREHIQRKREAVIASHRDRMRAQNRLNARALLIEFITGYCPDAALTRAFLARMNANSINYEDMIALLCVKAVMGEIFPVEGVHIALVDEAQDYSVLHHFLLKTLFPRADFTLLADIHQAVLPQIGIGSEALFAEMYPKYRAFRLTKSYRSTGPIGALAAKLIAHRETISYYEREGPEPEFIKTKDLAAETVRLCQNTTGTVAILTATMAQARALSREIGDRVPHTLLTAEAEDAFDRCLIMPVYFAKGLEFDRVVLADCNRDGFGAALEPNMLYLLCTRALHELYVLEGTGEAGERRGPPAASFFEKKLGKKL